MGLISSLFSSPPAGLVPVVFSTDRSAESCRRAKPFQQATESLEDAQPTTQAPENVCLGPVSTMLAFQGCFLRYSGRDASFHSALSTQPALLNSGESKEVLVQ